MEMNIRVGHFAQGVCIHSYHMPICSKQQLEEVINAYRYACLSTSAANTELFGEPLTAIRIKQTCVFSACGV
jgi:hypothetical protein|tara:strand:+ start:170 stop:385 length:216 start_codon:yes stop_codon:yes gene_type:complete